MKNCGDSWEKMNQRGTVVRGFRSRLARPERAEQRSAPLGKRHFQGSEGRAYVLC